MKPDESWRRDLFPLRKGRGLGVVNSNIDMGGGGINIYDYFIRRCGNFRDEDICPSDFSVACTGKNGAQDI